MLIDDLRSIVRENKGKEKIFLRNLLKEQLQYYVLDFVYSSRWGEHFLFKGGTCLRFCFKLPRLSEDLDFDVKNYENFDLAEFCRDLKNYFTKKLQMKQFNLKITGNNQQVFLKFPIMENLNLRTNRSQTNILFLRLDIQGVDSAIYDEKISLISKAGFSSIVKRYSLPDLFSSKIAAILNRSFKKGKNNQITFKGRDYFDLIWFLERNTKPNLARLEDITKINKKAVSKKLNKKIEKININYLKEDLSPLFPSQQFVNEFCNSFKSLCQKRRCPQCDSILTYREGATGIGAGSETDMPSLTKTHYKCSVCGKIFTKPTEA